MTEKEQEEGEDNSQIEEESHESIEELIDINEISDNIELTRELSSNFFLNYQSPSFICLQQVESSHSSFFKDLRNFFPLSAIIDPGIDDVFNYEPPEDAIDNIGIESYLKHCKQSKVIPYKHIINSLQTKVLNLKYFKLSLNEFAALKDSLKYNEFIETLVFQDNWLQPEQVEIISEILIENAHITKLDLQECRIGVKGAEKLQDGLMGTQFLIELNLSFNDLKDEGLQVLKDSLIMNVSIKILNLSHNEFTERSAKTVQDIITNNKCIEDLDLSWNYFYHNPSVKIMFQTLVDNRQIKRLNFASNAVSSKVGLSSILKAVKNNDTLEYLDISHNRFANDSVAVLKDAILRGTSLIEIRIGDNVYQPEKAQILAKALLDNQFNLKKLDMENMILNKTSLKLLKQIEAADKTIIYGHILSNYEIFGPDISQVLFARCNFMAQKPKKKKLKRNFGHFVLQLPDDLILKPDFDTLVKKFKIKLDKDLLNELTSNFSNKKAKIDCKRIKSEYLRLYPDTVLPEPTPKKKKKNKNQKKKGAKK